MTSTTTVRTRIPTQSARPAPGRSPQLAAFRALHDALTSGTWPEGTRLPGERTLAGELGVSRAHVRQALIELAELGLLESSAQRGWFVTGQRISEGPNLLRSFSETAAERGLHATTRVLLRRVRSATLDEAEVLGLAPAAGVVQIDRLRLLDGVPTAVQSACLPERRVPGLDGADLEASSLYEVLADQYEIVPTRCDYTVQAEAATGTIADLLGVEIGFPVLVGHEVTFDQHEQPISTGSVTYRGDAYRFKASLFRM
jgi:GntR family transcriptional regulator